MKKYSNYNMYIHLFTYIYIFFNLYIFFKFVYTFLHIYKFFYISIRDDLKMQYFTSSSVTRNKNLIVPKNKLRIIDKNSHKTTIITFNTTKGTKSFIEYPKRKLIKIE